MDINAIFLRNLASKGPSKNKLDSRFQIFQEICEADVLVEGADDVVDFTRCSYSIDNQNVVHLLTKEGEQTTLRQYSILEDDDDLRPFENAPRKIFIEPTRTKIVEDASKVFQFDEKVMIVGETKAQILDQNAFNKVEIKEFESANLDSFSLVNKTPKSKLYCRDSTVVSQ